MAVIHMLKMLADAALYYGFAVSVAASLGGGVLLLPCVLQCLCYGLAGGMKRGKWLWLLPMALCFCFGAAADRIAAVPVCIYIVFLLLKGTALPELEQQRDVFSGYKKLLPLIALLALVLKGWSGLMLIAPYVLLTLVSSVALMRALRHSPQVYCRRQYQMMDLGILAAVVAAAALLSSGPVAAAAVFLLDGAMRYVIRPLLMLAATVPVMLAQGVFWLLEGVIPEPDDTEQARPEMQGGEQLQTDTAWESWNSELLEGIFWIAAVIAVVVVLILLFRWLSKKRLAAPVQTQAGETVRISVQAKAAPRLAESGPVQSVRRHYRRYLKRYTKEGLPLQSSTTSGDILLKAQDHPEMAHNARPIRELYIRARYAGRATGEDAKTMARLCAQRQKRENSLPEKTGVSN